MKIPLYIAIYALLITLSSTKSNSSSNKTPRKKCGQQTSPGSCGQSACFCASGIPGIPGSPGPAGSPGNHGSEGPTGPKGNKGDEGSRGKQGPKGDTGPAGPSGKQGNKGTKGLTGNKGDKGSRGSLGPGGPTGSKGEPGARGIQGPQGTPGYAGALQSNWKQCVFKNLDNNQDTGLIKECIFKKTSDKTALRVFWNGDFRVYNCHRCCSRWYFTFNGAECSTPSAIDGIFIVWNHKSFVGNPHRPRHIEGICEKLRKGTVRVGFWVGKCVGTSYTGGDAATGFHSVSRIYVEEVSPPQA